MNDNLVERIKNKEIGPAFLTDHNICPTCFDKEHEFIVYGDNKERLLYQDDDIECLLINNPRSVGHTIISTNKHYKDMMELPDELLVKIIVFSKKLMNVLKEVYKCESVYMCTMCDGPMNHFHLQFIPRYNYEERGSKNFVKKRMEYIHHPEIIAILREKLK